MLYCPSQKKHKGHFQHMMLYECRLADLDGNTPCHDLHITASNDSIKSLCAYAWLICLALIIEITKTAEIVYIDNQKSSQVTVPRSSAMVHRHLDVIAEPLL